MPLDGLWLPILIDGEPGLKTMGVHLSRMSKNVATNIDFEIFNKDSAHHAIFKNPMLIDKKFRPKISVTLPKKVTAVSYVSGCQAFCTIQGNLYTGRSKLSSKIPLPIMPFEYLDQFC